MRRQLSRSAALTRDLSPGLAGITLASHAHGVIFTVVASDDEIASLDAIQYLVGGPFVTSVDSMSMTATSVGFGDTSQSRALARAAVAMGVRCVLTLPVVHGQRCIGTVNLYGRTESTFEDKHALVAMIFDMWAPTVVTSIRLAITTQRLLEQTSEPSDHRTVEKAAGALALAAGIDTGLALAQLHEAAACAGASLTTLARLLADGLGELR